MSDIKITIDKYDYDTLIKENEDLKKFISNKESSLVISDRDIKESRSVYYYFGDEAIKRRIQSELYGFVLDYVRDQIDKENWGAYANMNGENVFVTNKKVREMVKLNFDDKEKVSLANKFRSFFKF